jgi:hypothetical protein
MSRRKPWIYQPSPEEIAEKREQERVAKNAERWGVFPWEAANMYRAESAVKIYKRESAAEAYADKRNSEDPSANLVVRKIR